MKFVEAYFAAKLALLTQRQYRRDFGRNKVSNKRTIEDLIVKFWDTGSELNANKAHSQPH